VVCTPFPNGTVFCNIVTTVTKTQSGAVTKSVIPLWAILTIVMMLVMAVAFFAMFAIRLWGEGPWYRHLWHYQGPALILGNGDYHAQIFKLTRLRRTLYTYTIKLKDQTRMYLFRAAGKSYTTNGGPRLFFGDSTAGIAIPFPLLTFARKIKNFSSKTQIIDRPQDWENFVLQYYRQHLADAIEELSPSVARIVGGTYPPPTTLTSSVPTITRTSTSTAQEPVIIRKVVSPTEEQRRLQNESSLLDAIEGNKQYAVTLTVKNADGTETPQTFMLPKPTLDDKEALITRAEHILVGENPQYFPEYVDLRDAVYFKASISDTDLETAQLEGYLKGRGEKGTDHTKIFVYGLAVFLSCLGAYIILTAMKGGGL